MSDILPLYSKLYMDTSTYARGRKSLRVEAWDGRVTSSATPIASNPISEPSLHIDFFQVDNFDTYSAGEIYLDEQWHSYDVWPSSAPLGTFRNPSAIESDHQLTYYNNSEDIPPSCFARKYAGTIDLSNFNGISLYGKSNDSTCLYMSFVDYHGNQSEWSKFGFLPKRWGRMDASISWGECDPTLIEWVAYHYDAASGSVFWLDEMMVYGSNIDDKYTTWIPVLATDVETNRKGGLKVQNIAGRHPSILHVSNPQSKRGEFVFRTDFAQMDDELRFVRYCMRTHKKIYFRAGAEGWPIYLLEEKNKPLLQCGGYKTEITTDFVEAT